LSGFFLLYKRDEDGIDGVLWINDGWSMAGGGGGGGGGGGVNPAAPLGALLGIAGLGYGAYNSFYTGEFTCLGVVMVSEHQIL